MLQGPCAMLLLPLSLATRLLLGLRRRKLATATSQRVAAHATSYAATWSSML